MRRFSFTFLSILTLVFIALQGGAGWQLVHHKRAIVYTSGFGGTSPSGTPNNNHNICPIPSGVNHSGSASDLTLSAGGVMKNSQQYYAVLSAFNSYANCVAPNDPRQTSINCIPVHSAHSFYVCSFSLKETNINLGGTQTPGSPGVPGIATTCLSQLSEPRAYSTSRATGATLNFLPQKWLLDLPVEYTFHDPGNLNPSVTLSSPFSNPCYSPSPPQIVNLMSGGKVIGHRTTYISASATVSYAIAGTPTRISTGPIVGTLTAAGTGQFLQSVSCSSQTPLKQPGQIPTGMTSNLSELSTYFTDNHICNFDPNSSAFTNLAESPPGDNNTATLSISQEYTYSVPMTASWTTKVCTYIQNSYTAAYLKTHPNAFSGGGGCTPNSGSFGAQPSQTVAVYAQIVKKSAPIGYVAAQECAVINNNANTAVCPKQPVG